VRLSNVRSGIMLGVDEAWSYRFDEDAAVRACPLHEQLAARQEQHRD